MTFKQKIAEEYSEVIKNRIILVQNKLADLIDTAKNETKSSAGDKYETGRAMLQIEQDNVRRQLKEALEQKAVYDKIDFSIKQVKITQGSLVKTNKGFLFLSVALGKVVVDNIAVIALSPQSPLGSKLIGLNVLDTIMVNNTTYVIENIN